MPTVKQDERGIYLIAGGYPSRPGKVSGYGHAFNMDDGGLKIGDKVKAGHRSQTPLNVITLPDGSKRYWHHDYELYEKLRKEAAERFAHKQAKSGIPPSLAEEPLVENPACRVDKQSLVDTLNTRKMK